MSTVSSLVPGHHTLPPMMVVKIGRDLSLSLIQSAGFQLIYSIITDSNDKFSLKQLKLAILLKLHTFTGLIMTVCQ